MIMEAGKLHDLQDGDQRKLMILESEVLRTRSTNAWGQKADIPAQSDRERENPGPRWTGGGPPTCGRAVGCTQSSLIWKRPHRHQEIVFTKDLGTLGLGHNIDHHSVSGSHLSLGGLVCQCPRPHVRLEFHSHRAGWDLYGRRHWRPCSPCEGIVLGLSYLIRWDLWRDPGIGLIRLI